MTETLDTQRTRVLSALEAAPDGLTTAQMHSLGYCVNPRARVSELRKGGCVISCTPIPGTNSSRYKLDYRPELLSVAKAPKREKRLLGVTPASHTEIWV